MATIAALDITPGLVPAAETNIIGPVPASHEFDIPVIRFVNNDVNPITLTIWNKVGAGAGSNADKEATLTVQPQSTYEHGPLVLPAGRVIAVSASVAAQLSCRPSGWDIS